MGDRPMTMKQRRFLDEYLIDLNGKEAAIRAGYARNGAAVRAYKLLKLPQIQEGLRADVAASARRTGISLDRVLKQYARLAFSDMRRFSDWGPDDVKLRSHHRLTEDDTAAIAEVWSATARGGPRLKLHDKRPALDALARHLGMFAGRGPGAAPLYDSRAKRDARAVLRERIDEIVQAREAAKKGP